MIEWEGLLDQAEISITQGRPEKVIDLCASQGVRLSQISPVMGGIRAKAPCRDLKKIDAIARQAGSQLELLGRTGPGRKLKRYHSRLGLLLGPLLAWWLVQMSGDVIWSVQYLNLTASQVQLVEECLWECQLVPGQPAPQETLRQAEQRLMSEHEEFGWVTLNMVEGRLTVECTQAMKEQSLPQSWDTDLVAVTDGVIVAQDVRLGFTQTQVGQQVRAGEVLVSCYKLDHGGQPVWQNTYGTVTARFDLDYIVRQPLEYKATVPQKLGRPSYTFTVGDRQLHLGEEPQGENVLRYHYGAKLLGLALPLTVTRAYSPDYQEVQFTLTPQQAKELAEYHCRCQFLQEYPGGKIISAQTSCQVQEGELVCLWRAQAEANIARPSAQRPVPDTIQQ